MSVLLRVGNLFLSSANVIVAFSLLAYIATHNLRSPVARAFCALLSFVLVVFAGDVILDSVDTLDAAAPWLRLQWLGIAFVPAAYLHLSDALLRTTGAFSRLRRALVGAGYALGAVGFILATFTDWVVCDGVQDGVIFQLRAGPLFWAFAVYYFAVTLSGLFNIRRARARCLTSTSRRRMAYLGVAFAAPGLGVFPYLLSATMSQHLSVDAVLAIALVGNMAVALMTIVMGYIVAYQGVLLPDRVIKHSLLHYLMRGPVVAAAMLVLVLVIPRMERILGIQRDTVLIFAIVLVGVLSQVLIILAKPGIDRLVYRKDRAEITWIQELDKRLLTSSDLEQILENVLVALCDLLRVGAGFVVTMSGEELHLQVFCGPREPATAFLSRALPSELVTCLEGSRRGEHLVESDFALRNGYALLPLRSQDGRLTLGILGIENWAPPGTSTAAELEAVEGLVRRAELALDDMRLQQQVFAALRRMEPEIERLQRWGSTPRYVRSSQLEGLETSPLSSPNFTTMVKDALSHYWGGPKLSKSPLLRLRIVQKAMAASDRVPTKALRAVLRDAIERLRPSSQPSLTASEWVVYNILNLRYLRGERIRHVARSLAMSESDFYRKQRVAIEELAKTLAAMEEETRSQAGNSSQSSQA
ncbi:MAG: histidine kinase N-terminal 7TM domain-containing protein, partial [Anaerolineae bacterium]|nr:histidine kinase N-terminal 7TM domain-containing protein [Anaerolineae bacterium]